MTLLPGLKPARFFTGRMIEGAADRIDAGQQVYARSRGRGL